MIIFSMAVGLSFDQSDIRSAPLQRVALFLRFVPTAREPQPRPVQLDAHAPHAAFTYMCVFLSILACVCARDIFSITYRVTDYAHATNQSAIGRNFPRYCMDSPGIGYR